MPLLSLLAALLGLAFAATVFRRWLMRRSPYTLAWTIGLLMFAIASAAGYLSRTAGPTEAAYRVFYLFGAIANVAWLAVGTLYLLAPRRVAHVGLITAIHITVIGAFVVLTNPVDLRVALDTGRGFPDGSSPRLFAAVGSGLGSLILIGGALWSAWIFYRRRVQGRRALANVLIAAGVLIVAAGGTVTFTGASGILEYTNLVGLAVMFAGFLLI